MAEQGKDSLNDFSFNPPASILIIDDSDLNRRMIKSLFKPLNYIIMEATNGKAGFALARENLPEIILLDIMMPVNDGYEVCKWLKDDPLTDDIPLIFITALDSIQEKIRGFEVGAVDFVTKPFNYREVVARVRTHIALKRASGEREKMLSMALEQKRNAIIARIAAGVSHNFSNLLSVSVGNLMFAECVLGDSVPQDVKNAMSDIRKSLEKQKSLVKQFLRLANRGAIESTVPSPESLDLHVLLDEVIENVKIQGDSLALKTQIHNHLNPGTTVYGDPAHFREIFYLLLHEAIESSQGKAKATIESGLRQEDGSERVTVLIDGIEYDSGLGDAIFEPYALPLANVGTGLAFSVTKNLIEKNEGKVSVSYPAPKQVCLTFDFPTPPKQEQ